MESKNNNSVYPVIPESLNHDQSIPPPPPYYASAQNQQNMIYGASAPPNNIYQTPSAYVQPTVIIQPQRWFPLSRNPVAMNCPQCNARILSRTTKDIGGGTWLISGGICLAGCVFPILWFGCCLIPFCIDDCKDTSHFCPNCHVHIGTHTL